MVDLPTRLRVVRGSLCWMWICICGICCNALGQERISDAKGQDVYGDPLPAGAVTRLGTLRYRHSGWYKRVAFLSDNRTFAVGTKDNTVRLWDAASGKLVREIDTEGARLRAFAVSPDGNQLAVLLGTYLSEARQFSMQVKILTVWTGRTNDAFQWVDEAADAPEQFALAPDGQIVATGDRKGQVKLWNARQRTVVAWRSLIGGAVDSIDFSPDGQTMAVGGRQGVAIWNWRTDEEPIAPPELRRGAQIVRFSNDGQLLAVGPSDSEAAKIWNVAEQRWQHALKGNQANYYREGLCFSPDGSLLVVPAHQLAGIEFFDLSTGQLTRSLSTGTVESRDVAVSGDGKYAVSVGSQDAIQVFDLDSGELLTERFVGHVESPHELLFSSDGTQVVTAGMDGTIRTWDSHSGRQLQQLSHGRWVSAMCLSADGQRLVSCSLDDTLRLWDTTTGQVLQEVDGHGKTGGNRLTKVKLTEDGRTFVSFGHDLLIRSWDASTGRSISQHDVRPSGLAIDRDRNGELLLNGARMEGPGGVSSILNDAFFDHQGRFFLGVQDTVHVFSVETGKEVEVFKGRQPFDGFVISSDGNLLATVQRIPRERNQDRADYSSLLRIYDFASADKKLLHEIPLRGGWSQVMALSPDRHWLAASMYGSSPTKGVNNWISICDVHQGREVALIEHVEDSGMIAFSPDGQRVAVSNENATVLIWDWQQLRLPAE